MSELLENARVGDVVASYFRTAAVFHDSASTSVAAGAGPSPTRAAERASIPPPS